MNSLLKKDKISRQVESVLREHYLPRLNGAQLDVYRAYATSVWIRVIHPSFSGRTIPDRGNAIWTVIVELLPDDLVSLITCCILITPDELDSPANIDFENPSPLIA